MAITKQVNLRLPIELAIKYEYQAAKLNMSLPQYLIHLLSTPDMPNVSKRIDEIHLMLARIHDDYFE
ncbi:hypothetical protein [Acinetobacter faecalis]|uniref:hypothetical protein n=1 Tax=Acinetobacter faecalis TaxID=2665161 RepID=UPI002A917655|nr:hypothetical protein [Acinetobacter faecalis]MDY6458114.1 hypothetical protein [Acinetobacter faecalis]